MNPYEEAAAGFEDSQQPMDSQVLQSPQRVIEDPNEAETEEEGYESEFPAVGDVLSQKQMEHMKNVWPGAAFGDTKKDEETTGDTKKVEEAAGDKTDAAYDGMFESSQEREEFMEYDKGSGMQPQEVKSLTKLLTDIGWLEGAPGDTKNV